MIFTSLLLVVIAGFIAWQLRGPNLVAATSEDWFVVFDVDAEEKRLGLWFYPVIAFHPLAESTLPIPSRPAHAAKAASMRPYKQVDDSMYGASGSSACWVRDNALFDKNGHPNSRESFSEKIEGYLQEDFKLLFLTTIPDKYEKIIIKSRKQVQSINEENA